MLLWIHCIIMHDYAVYIHYILLYYDYLVYILHKAQSMGECVSKPFYHSNHSSTVYNVENYKDFS